MIRVEKSSTADTRTCDHSQVSMKQLAASSLSHIGDVQRGLGYMSGLLFIAGRKHDHDKISDEGLAAFHKDFANNFETKDWWNNHRKVNRHHLNIPDGVPDDVDLVDVIEHVVDCVMAGMARSGDFYMVELPAELLQRAVKNTANKLVAQIEVVE